MSRFIKGTLPLYLLIGLVQGLSMLLALELKQPALGVAAAVLGINLQLLGERWHQRVPLAWTVLVAATMALITEWVMHASAQSSLAFSWGVCALVIGYVATAFIASAPARQGRRVPYPALFRHAWNNAFIVLLAVVLSWLFWGLLMLCASLFEMIGIGALKDGINHRYVLLLVMPVVFSVGMRMGCENDKVIGLLRGILLSLCRFLAPLAALIVVLFCLSLPFTGLASIWSTGYASRILLGLVAITLFLVNGVFQDGQQPAAYPCWLRQLINLSLVCLPVLTALAGYSTWLRLDQYGLSPSRFFALLVVAFAALYSLAAMYAVLRSPQGWLGSLRWSNPWQALLVCVVLLLIHGPGLNPQALSASNQLQRLLDGRTQPAEFDAAHMHRKLGKPGRETFEWLLTNLDRLAQFSAQDRELLRNRLEVERDYRKRDSLPVAAANRVWIGTPVPGHEQFANPRLGLQSCNQHPCVLWPVDLDADGQAEVVLFSADTSWLAFFQRLEDGNWERVGYLEGDYGPDDLPERVRQGKFRLVPPRYQGLEIDGHRFFPKERFWP
ncbi:DUF4153 domain-containing protein [Pseudomonas sp. 21LCFQ02]|uniref:DUF4153 domain-containing protein n=1 Tax=Pseudomonas sp. 21LCFQ02 TaxID=2957505 RepID=UPI00209B2E01|nr:DUF4153 domain-containing protein [Pseudomonas sp. 21LCFQ02]MCO8170939.1 DUF4153 domain-containing protein [Pseudomonas sp. 21LCFQ02]